MNQEIFILGRNGLERLSKAPQLKRGEIIMHNGFACNSQEYVVTDPVSRKAVRVYDASDEYLRQEAREEAREENMLRPLSIRYDEFIRPISEIFGIGVYYYTEEDKKQYGTSDLNEEQTARYEDMAKRFEIYLSQEQEKAKREFETAKEDAIKNYPYLTVLENYCSAKGTADNLRTLLKVKFPGIRFSVTRPHYDCINVRYNCKELDVHTVDAVAQMFSDYAGVRMDDYIETKRSAFNTVFGSQTYIFTYNDETVKESHLKAESEEPAQKAQKGVLLLERYGDKLAITGDTYPRRKEIKSIGATWNKFKKAWIFTADKADEIKSAFGLSI